MWNENEWQNVTKCQRIYYIRKFNFVIYSFVFNILIIYSVVVIWVEGMLKKLSGNMGLCGSWKDDNSFTFSE